MNNHSLYKPFFILCRGKLKTSNMLKKKIENTPYKAFVVDSLTNPRTNQKESLQVTLYKQEIKLGSISGIQDDPIVVFRTLEKNEIIPKKEWSKEMHNFAQQLIVLYPIPDLDTRKYKSAKISPEVVKWGLASLVLLIIIFIIYRKITLSM